MIVVHRIGDERVASIDWSPILPANVTVSSVVHTVSTGMTIMAQSNDSTSSTAKISGGAHAGLYTLTGTATLSSGEKLVRSFPLRGWAGA